MLQVATIPYLSTNAYEVPWLHLDIANCVIKFLGHHCIHTFVIFLLLVATFEQVQQSFYSLLSHFCCHMPHGFKV
jgi:hypothetical protein